MTLIFCRKERSSFPDDEFEPDGQGGWIHKPKSDPNGHPAGAAPPGPWNPPARRVDEDER
jgi:hypothetical protein